MHPAKSGFGRRAPVDRYQRVLRHADVPVANATDEPLDIGGGFAPLVFPDPEAAVAISRALVLRRRLLGGVGKVQIVVEHADRRLTVGLLIAGPDIVGVIVGAEIDALGGRGRRRFLGARHRRQSYAGNDRESRQERSPKRWSCG